MPRLLYVLVPTLAFAAGCSREVDRVEVTRSLVRNAAALVQYIDEDVGCGFDSPTARVEVDGVPGALGRATFTIRDCIPTFPDPTRTRECRPLRRVLSGAVRVTGVRTVVGTVTGDPAMPIIADGPYATSIVMDAVLEGFVGDGDDDRVDLLGIDGALSVEAKLARAAGSGGGCTASTPNIALTSMRYSNATVEVVDGADQRTIDVGTTAIHAVQGVVGAEENLLDGSTRIDGTTEDLPPDVALDPNYNAGAFLESYACADDLVLPVSFECTAPSPAAATRLAAKSAEALAWVAQIARIDPGCGFDVAGPVVEATNGGASAATRHIESCRIDLGTGQVIATNCGHGDLVASGVVTVSGSLRVDGRPTAEGADRVVPSSDNAMTIDLTEVVFEGFGLRRGEDHFVISGHAAGEVQPRLARAENASFCTTPTPVVHIREVSLFGTLVALDSPQEHAQGLIESSMLTATIGAWDDTENTLAGTVTIGGQTSTVDARFDPRYDRVDFDADWQCSAPKNPFVCDAKASVGLDIARASTMTFQTIGALSEADTTCGFSSPDVVTNVEITGAVGSSTGRGVFRIADCVLQFDRPTVVAEDCYGVQTIAQGRVSVGGTKTVTGWVTGDVTAPMLATARSNVRYELALDVDDLRVRATDGVLARRDIDLVRGVMRGAYLPRVAIDEDNGACTRITPEARIETLALESMLVRTADDRRALEVTIDGASLNATIGRFDESDKNTVRGQITVDGQSVTLPATDLDTNFDARRFVAGFSCREGLFIPFDDKDCDMRQVLAEVGARLLVQSIGAVTEVVNRDDFDCAFGGDDVFDDPSQVVGQLGEPGYIQWQIPNCRLRFGDNQQGQPFERDCRDDGKFFDGAATVDAAREVRGIRDEIGVTFGSDIDYVHPLEPNATRIDYRSVMFADFSAYTLARMETTAEEQLTIHAGTLAGTVEPMTGPDDGSDEYFDEGDYDIATPIARITGLIATQIDATIRYDNKRFRVAIDGSNLGAFNGSWLGAMHEANSISGSIVIDGRTIELTGPGELDPDYDQVAFDASYVCTERLLQTLPPAQ